MRSTLAAGVVAGTSTVQPMPRAAAACATAIPALPEESRNISATPRRSAAAAITSAPRSLYEPAGAEPCWQIHTSLPGSPAPAGSMAYKPGGAATERPGSSAASSPSAGAQRRSPAAGAEGCQAKPSP
jgi:hypothetical protein